MKKEDETRGRKPISKDRVKVIAQEKLNEIGGKVTDVQYTNVVNTRGVRNEAGVVEWPERWVWNVEWICIKGHTCHHRFSSIRGLAKVYCRRCRGKRSVLTLEVIREEAKNRGAEMISIGYTNFRTPLSWKCACGKIFYATSDVLRYRTIKCQECRGISVSGRDNYKKTRLVNAASMAAAYGGLCLSTEYISSYAKMKWCCDSGHEWEATFNSVKFGSWCPECARLRRCKK